MLKKDNCYIYKAHNLPCSPKKVRLMTRLINGKTIDKALGVLRIMPTKAAMLLRSQLGTMTNNLKQIGVTNANVFSIQSCSVSLGNHDKRKVCFNAKGRVNFLITRRSNLCVFLEAINVHN